MQKLNFTGRGNFYGTLRQRVDGYFKEREISKNDSPMMYLKTTIILAAFFSCYYGLVFYVENWWSALLVGFGLAQSMILIGFNIQHDGGHKGYSKNRLINRIMALSLDMIGGSHYLWDLKHNKLHHTYTNIDELDDDIHAGPFLRLSPRQAWKPWHRLQAFYALVVYGFLTLSWVTYSDFYEFTARRIGDYRLPKPSKSVSFVFYGGKLFYFAYTLVLPCLLHPIWQVAIAFFAIHFVLGFTLSIVFQLAHTVEDTTFPVPDTDPDRIENEWAIHQFETTANFAPTSKFANWYMGGLNFQVEHHVFSRITHIHYPAISGIVRQTCEEFGVPYHSAPTMLGAVKSHLRFLHRLSFKPES